MGPNDADDRSTAFDDILTDIRKDAATEPQVRDAAELELSRLDELAVLAAIRYVRSLRARDRLDQQVAMLDGGLAWFVLPKQPGRAILYLESSEQFVIGIPSTERGDGQHGPWPLPDARYVRDWEKFCEKTQVGRLLGESRQLQGYWVEHHDRHESYYSPSYGELVRSFIRTLDDRLSGLGVDWIRI